MRKKGDKSIKVLTKKDAKGIKMLARTGHVKPETLKSYTGLTENRINTYFNMNIIEKVYDNNSDDQYLRLTCLGRIFALNNFDIVPYKSNSPRHDAGIVDYYMKLNDDEQDSWRTETELSHELRDMDQFTDDLSPTDFCYTRNDETVYVEIVTEFYSPDDIQAKENFVEMTGGTYEQINI